MTRKNPPVEENDEKNLVVGDGPKDWAAGTRYQMREKLLSIGDDY